MEVSRHKEQLHQIAKEVQPKQHESENHTRKDPSALKDALTDALKSAPEAGGDAKPKPREEEKPAKESVSSSESKKESVDAGAVADKNTKAGEVPESVLRNMLDVKDESR